MNIRINPDVGGLKLRDTFDACSTERGNSYRCCRRRVTLGDGGLFEFDNIFGTKSLALIVLTLSPVCWVSHSTPGKWVLIFLDNL